MNYRFLLIIFVILAAVAVAGCTEQNTEESPQETPSNETVEIVEIPAETEQPSNVTSDEVLKVPVLQIMSVSPLDWGLDIKVKNVGNTVAHNVYCGAVSYGGSNSMAYPEWMTKGTTEETRAPVVAALKAGMTGDGYGYDTGYQYKGNNLTIYTRLIGRNYVGDIEPGYTASTYIQRSFDSVGCENELLKVAWMAGDETNFVIY